MTLRARRRSELQPSELSGLTCVTADMFGVSSSVADMDVLSDLLLVRSNPVLESLAGLTSLTSIAAAPGGRRTITRVT
jgi:hypothetical protein